MSQYIETKEQSRIIDFSATLTTSVVTHKYISFEEEDILLDGNGYQTCCFRNCTLRYAGGESPQFVNCTFSSCNWVLGQLEVNDLKLMAILESTSRTALLANLGDAVRMLSAQPNKLIEEAV